MTRAVRSRLIARVAARRSGEQGLTLIELLLSLAILAILTGFLAGGLSMARQAFGADRASEIGSETSAAIQTVAALVGSALPVRADGAGPKDAIGRDGRYEGGRTRSSCGGAAVISSLISRRLTGRARRRTPNQPQPGSWCLAACAKFALGISVPSMPRSSQPGAPIGFAPSGCRIWFRSGSNLRTSGVTSPPPSWRCVRASA